MKFIKNKLYNEKDFLLKCANKANNVYKQSSRDNKHYEILYDESENVLYITFRE